MTFEAVRKLTMPQFKGLQIMLDVLEAEERLILQRQLDNHIKIGNPKLIKDFSNIYEEFQNVVFSELKIVKDTESKIDADTAKALWGNTLSKLKGR